MPRFEVSIPFAGYLTGEVEAADEKSAIKAAMEQCDFQVVVNPACNFECAEVQTLDEITRGNTSYAPLNKASADQMADE